MMLVATAYRLDPIKAMAAIDISDERSTSLADLFSETETKIHHGEQAEALALLAEIQDKISVSGSSLAGWGEIFSDGLIFFHVFCNVFKTSIVYQSWR